MNRGFTLIETLIYIALMAFLLGAGLMTAFYVVDASAENKYEVNVHAEGTFILRKIDWALTGATSATAVSVTELSVVKGGTTYVFRHNGNNMQMKEGTGAYVNLNGSTVAVSAASFAVDTSVTPNKITVSVTIAPVQEPTDTTAFNLVKYLRI